MIKYLRQSISSEPSWQSRRRSQRRPCGMHAPSWHVNSSWRHCGFGADVDVVCVSIAIVNKADTQKTFHCLQILSMHGWMWLRWTKTELTRTSALIIAIWALIMSITAMWIIETNLFAWAFVDGTFLQIQTTSNTRMRNFGRTGGLHIKCKYTHNRWPRWGWWVMWFISLRIRAIQFITTVWTVVCAIAFAIGWMANAATEKFMLFTFLVVDVVMMV